MQTAIEYRTYIGIDNGVTGSIGIIVVKNSYPSSHLFIPMPTIVEQDYTKAPKAVKRIDYKILKQIILHYKDMNPIILLERPRINNTNFWTSISAARAHEATLIAIEEVGIPLYNGRCIDSRNWQSELLPNVKGHDNLKQASKDVGKKMFPTIKTSLRDYDGLLIAEWGKRKRL